MATRPKLSAREMVPDLFAHFMREVVVAIDENDEAAWMESEIFSNAREPMEACTMRMRAAMVLPTSLMMTKTFAMSEMTSVGTLI